MTFKLLIVLSMMLLSASLPHLPSAFAKDVHTDIPLKLSQDSHAVLYKKAISILMDAEDDFIATPPRWMPAAAGCQQVIKLLPQLEEAAKKLTPVHRPKIKVSKAIDEICTSILEFALKKLTPRTCKGYWMLRNAFDYVEKRDTALWKPRLKKLLRCRK